MRSPQLLSLVVRCAAAVLAAAAVLVALLPQPTPAAPTPIVTAVNIKGNAHVPTDRIGGVIRTRPGTPLDTKQIAADQNAILGLGYFSDVKTDLRAAPGGVAVTFIVIENPVVTKITFDGNTHVSSDILTALMDTSTGSVLDTNTLRDDVAKINSYYDKLGYTGTRHVRNIHIDPNGNLLIDIKEGVTVTKIDVSGNKVINTQAILAVMKTKPGTTFSQQVFSDDLQAVQNLYKDLGFSAIVDGNVDPNSAGTVDVTVCESKVGAVEILGNSKTKDYVIRRLLLLHPGDLITDNRLRRDYDAINNTQFFKSVDLSIKPFGDKCGYVTLVWTVQEQRTGTASVGLSYGGGGTYGQGLSGNISYTESNVNGTGNGASIAASRGQYTSNVNFGITIPYLHKFKATSLAVNIFNNVVSNQPYPVYKEAGNNPFYSLSPPGGSITGPLTATPVPGTSASCQASSTPCSGIFADYSSRQSGLSLTTGHPVADYTRLYYGLAATRLYQAFTAQGFPNTLLDQTSLGVTTPGGAVTVGANQPASTLNSLNASLVRDNRDDVQNPRYGGVTSIYDEVSGPFIGSNFRYDKGIFQLTRFYPVRRHSTFGFNFVWGFSTGGTSLPYNELFSLSDQQLRGTKYVYYGNRELLGQAEVRVPVTSDRKLEVVFFADSGSAPYIQAVPGATPAPTPQPPSGPHAPVVPGPLPKVTYRQLPYSFLTDAGIGIRLTTPILPQQIRIDLATSQQGSHISFGFGQAF
ncbi:MAG: BamA/TamA family outer membrane protein [Candidatus Eremiobacteraeota bacterium]|nr:BamA/TamA family outer membrane protein [Candidatus Eremiobacteraeota bacterium]